MSRVGLHCERSALAARGIGLRTTFKDALPRTFCAAAHAGRTWVGLFDLARWQAWLPDAWDIIDADERRRVERRRSSAARDDLALGYALHRLLLAAAMDCDATAVPLVRDVRGCPRLRGDASWTSLTHADGAVGVAFGTAGPVGIDMELASRAASMAAIAQRVCHPVDSAALAGLLPPAWTMALLQVWVRKEALLKAAGIGLEQEMDSFPAYADGDYQLMPSGIGSTCAATLNAGREWVAAVAAPAGSAVDVAWIAPHTPARQ